MSVVKFETPENITVTYRLAGPGTRFLAFIFDSLLIVLAFLLIGLAVVLVAAAMGDQFTQPMMIIVAIVFGIGFGFVFIAYFGVFEWFTEGHTPGKRLLDIRVVTAEGFSLTFTGVLIRNIFRVIDVIPLLWVVPVVTAKLQRFGDMVAGTIVVREFPVTAPPIREALATRRPEEAQFTFNSEQVTRLRDVDVQAVETFLERRERLHPDHRLSVARRLVRGLSERLEAFPPESDPERERFLEDLLATYARREAREF